MVLMHVMAQPIRFASDGAADQVRFRVRADAARSDAHSDSIRVTISILKGCLHQRSDLWKGLLQPGL
eukprot:4147477-Pyramimonas_sp.AAC.1